MTPEEVARSQAESCKCDVIVDAYAGAGGNSIQFARTCGFGKYFIIFTPVSFK